MDRRVERTKHALGAALMQLMLERRFDAITVQDVRALAAATHRSAPFL
jgi:hypothetical protein